MHDYWNHAMKLDWAKQHPHVPECELASTLPIVYRMDGAEVYRNQEYYIWSWSSDLTAGTACTWDTKFPICTIPYMLMSSKDTRFGVFKKMGELTAWVHDAWVSGRYPDIGFKGEEFDPKSLRYALRGKQIADGMCAIYVGVKGDRKSRKELHRFERHYGKSFICERCLACLPGKIAPFFLTYGDFTSSAAWRQTEFTHA
eukprot:505464-Pyramimonas_sp.AAC.1